MSRRRRGRDLVPVHDVAIDLIRDLDRVRDRARDRSHNLDRHVVGALIAAHDLRRACDQHHASELDLARARDFARVLDYHLARTRTRGGRIHLGEAFRAAEMRAETLRRYLSVEAVRDPAAAYPGRLVRWIVELALRVVPAAERARYAQEFRVELLDLPRSQRLPYALRVVRRSLPLRRSLRTPACRPARDG